MLFDVSNRSFRDVGDLGDFGKGMSATLDQAQDATPFFRGPLMSLHDVLHQLRRN